jgi:hypothetical protein
MAFFYSMKSFWPQGREIYVALILIGIIVGACYLNVCLMCDKVAKRSDAHPQTTSSPSFNLERISVDPKKILSGGPPKDGIPALTNPQMVYAGETEYLRPSDRVVGIFINNEARAYPLRILQWHEVINDEAGNISFAVVYCPLCDSTTVFDRKVDDEILEFGVSGMLYQSNVLIYDRQSDAEDESLWSQLKGEAISGKRMGKQLTHLPHQLITWAEWTKGHPDTLVLSDITGYDRKYKDNIYQEYFDNENLMFPVDVSSDKLPFKMPVIGFRGNGESKAFPLALLQNGRPVHDAIGGIPIVIKKIDERQAWVEAGEGVDVIHSFWFSWYAFNPDAVLYRPNSVHASY